MQEYLGSYVADEQGRLVFREGALVTAVRQGHWVVLDELNLAPSEVLEALNRRAVPLALALQLPLKMLCQHPAVMAVCGAAPYPEHQCLYHFPCKAQGFRVAAHQGCAVCSDGHKPMAA